MASVSRRIESLDIVRGLAMVLMAIDHVRVYSGQPAGGPTPGIFFTRWVTHFVAPTFVFLAGTSAYLFGKSVADKRVLSRFLLTRGLWLVFLELTVIRVCWTFNFDFAHYMLAGVIWMIGWCMVLMSALVFLPTMVVGGIGVAIILLHNIFDYFHEPMQNLANGSLGWLWKVLYLGGGFDIGTGGPPLLVLFVLVPWIGVMMAGYAFGRVMERPADERRTFNLRLGVVLTIAFVVIRATNSYGDPRHWKDPMQFLATNKYPASLLFLLMTLGPMLVALAFAEGARGRFARVMGTFGRVPFFYYLLHIPVIHVLACGVSLVREGSVNPWLLGNFPLAPGEQPPGYMWSLPLLYLVFVIAIAILYFPCRWFAAMKAEKRSTLLSYL
jgi:uncharacterized membrane protein